MPFFVYFYIPVALYTQSRPLRVKNRRGIPQSHPLPLKMYRENPFFVIECIYTKFPVGELLNNSGRTVVNPETVAEPVGED